MPPLLFALILGAALLHATWNAMLRSSGDRLPTITVINVTAGLVALPFALLSPLPVAAAWPYIILSALIHIVYSLLLVNNYQQGELGQVYPITRGSSPLLVTLGAAFFAGEKLTPFTIAGIVLVCCGIFALARGKNRPSATLIVSAVATGGMVASYTVVDGIGARITGHALSYAAWMFVIYGAMMAVFFATQRKRTRINLASATTRKAALAGILCLTGYYAIIWAISIHTMGPVSALRETSVVFAALIGYFFLDEKLTPRRIGACIVIAAGAACLG